LLNMPAGMGLARIGATSLIVFPNPMLFVIIIQKHEPVHDDTCIILFKFGRFSECMASISGALRPTAASSLQACSPGQNETSALQPQCALLAIPIGFHSA